MPPEAAASVRAPPMAMAVLAGAPAAPDALVAPAGPAVAPLAMAVPLLAEEVNMGPEEVEALVPEPVLVTGVVEPLLPALAAAPWLTPLALSDVPPAGVPRMSVASAPCGSLPPQAARTTSRGGTSSRNGLYFC